MMIRRNMTAFVNSLATLVLVAAIAMGCASAGESADSSAAFDTYVLTVEGMTCSQSCPPAVKEALETLEGVQRVDVDFENKRAVVRVDDGTSLTIEECDAAFGNSGYFVEAIDPLPPGE